MFLVGKLLPPPLPCSYGHENTGLAVCQIRVAEWVADLFIKAYYYITSGHCFMAYS